jgi:hypothetical protein
MATAVSGSRKRPAPCRFRDRAKTGGVAGQSPKSGRSAPTPMRSLAAIRELGRQRASCRANRNARGVNPVRARNTR